MNVADGCAWRGLCTVTLIRLLISRRKAILKLRLLLWGHGDLQSYLRVMDAVSLEGEDEEYG